MPRDGAIIFSDLIGKLDVLRVACAGRYRLDRLIKYRGREAKLIDWLDEITTDCPKRSASERPRQKTELREDFVRSLPTRASRSESRDQPDGKDAIDMQKPCQGIKRENQGKEGHTPRRDDSTRCRN
jgi:hypothetical protein